MRTIYWDTGSLFLYLIEAFIGMVCLTHVCRANKGTSISTKSYLPYAITFIFTWGLFAAFRHVSNGIGGADAIDYVDFFKGCWGNMDAHMEHTASDVLYLYLNRFVRLFTSSYYSLWLYRCFDPAVCKKIWERLRKYDTSFFGFLFILKGI